MEKVSQMKNVHPNEKSTQINYTQMKNYTPKDTCIQTNSLPNAKSIH